MTRLPFPDPGPPLPEETGRSVVWYPIVGLIAGALIAAAAALSSPLDPGLAATLVLLLWVWLTGALHMDGLADSADAWVGGLGSRERTLEIMKDPRCGPSGVTSIALVLVAKWSALQVLCSVHALWPLLLLPMLGRTQLPLILLTTPYARQQGMASDQFHQLPRRAAWLSVAGACTLSVALGGWTAAVLIGAMLALFALARRAMVQRLAGFTGDTAGALVELTETLLILICAGLS